MSAPFARAFELLRESCGSGHDNPYLRARMRECYGPHPPWRHGPYLKKIRIEVPFNPESPRANPECSAEIPSDLHNLRDFENYYKSSLVRLERNRRSHLTLRAPVWPGEARPFGARSVKLHSRSLKKRDFAFLVEVLGYSRASALAGVVLSTRGAATGRHSVSPTEDDGDPSHPFIAEKPVRRTFQGGGITLKDVSLKVRQHNWSLSMMEGVIDVLAKRRSPQAVAAARGLNYQTLKNNSRIIRQQIQGSGADLHVDVG